MIPRMRVMIFSCRRLGEAVRSAVEGEAEEAGSGFAADVVNKVAVLRDLFLNEGKELGSVFLRLSDAFGGDFGLNQLPLSSMFLQSLRSSKRSTLPSMNA